MTELSNKVFISTQPEEGFPDLVACFTGTGATLINFPMISVVELPACQDNQQLLRQISDFNWVVFTSKNGVQHFLSCFERANARPFTEGLVKTAVIGYKTGFELQKIGVKPDFISASNNAETFVAELKAQVIPEGSKVLLMLGNLAGTTIEDALSGFTEYKRINCYETIRPGVVDDELLMRINKDKYDLLIFTSSSGFDNFVLWLNEKEVPLKGLRMVSIGKSTTSSMLKQGATPLFTAQHSNLSGIADTIKEFYKHKS